jgi:hypothetical protein
MRIEARVVYNKDGRFFGHLLIVFLFDGGRGLFIALR